MFIDISKVDVRQFRVSNRRHPILGDVVLITPGFDKHVWNGDEHLRSLMLRPNGEVICSGFPKFRNYGENQDLDKITLNSIVNDEASFFTKLDGSLVIRSVIDGYVNFRTRGSDTLGEFTDAVMSVINNKYPKLLDADIKSDETLLFEFTTASIDRKIIVEYTEDDLTLLGGMNIKSGELPSVLGGKHYLENAKKSLGLTISESHSLGIDPKSIVESVSSWVGQEGVVAWCITEFGWHLAKIKSEWYSGLHVLKYNLSADKIQKIAFIRNIDSAEKLKTELFSMGLDWEAFEIAKPRFIQYIDRKNSVMSDAQKLLEDVKASGAIENPSRKHKAIILKQMCDGRKDFSLAMLYALGENDRAERYVLSRTLDISVNHLDAYIANANIFLQELNSKL